MEHPTRGKGHPSRFNLNFDEDVSEIDVHSARLLRAGVRGFPFWCSLVVLVIYFGFWMDIDGIFVTFVLPHPLVVHALPLFCFFPLPAWCVVVGSHLLELLLLETSRFGASRSPSLFWAQSTLQSHPLGLTDEPHPVCISIHGETVAATGRSREVAPALLPPRLDLHHGVAEISLFKSSRSARAVKGYTPFWAADGAYPLTAHLTRTSQGRRVFVQTP